MKKLEMCRICLVENVRMHLVVNKSLHELYEKLTNVPFVTEDSRPLLACFICFSKLKQCHQLLSRCMEAEKLFTQMINGNNKPLKNRSQLQFHNGLIRTAIDTTNIVGDGQTECIPVKQELPDYNDMLHNVIEPKEEHLCDELEPEHHENSCSQLVDTAQHTEYEVPVVEVKIEVQEEQVVSHKRRVSETDRMTVGKKLKLEDTITANHEEDEQAHASVARNQHLTTEHVTTSKEPFQPKVNNSISDIKDKNSDRKPFKEKPHKCDTCPRSFYHMWSLRRHQRIHNTDRPFKCDICQRGFNVKYILEIHKRVHTGQKPFKCDTCQRKFSEKQGLISHIRIHTGEKPYKCDICQHSCRSKSTLNTHIRIHTGEKRFKCDTCQRTFTAKKSLINHNRIHTGEKPYKCDICQRSFRSKSTIQTHIRIHTGFKCDICQRTFTAQKSLNSHIRSHTGEKPYKCDICQRCFNVKYSLSNHMKRVHNSDAANSC